MTKSSAPESFTCCDVRIDGGTVEWAVERLVVAAAAGRPLAVHLCNAFTLSLAIKDPQYRAMLNRADLNLPDGTPVSWVGRLMGKRGATGPVPGPALMVAAFQREHGRVMRHFLLGSSSEVLDALESRLTETSGGCSIVGRLAPPFTPSVTDLVEASVEQIAASGANVVWVGLGTPKQDWFVDEVTARLDVVAVPVGAAFDFIAGNKAEAPQWLRGSGLEWLFRLGAEPGRLWRRYLVGNPRFVVGAFRSIMASGRRQAS